MMGSAAADPRPKTWRIFHVQYPEKHTAAGLRPINQQLLVCFIAFIVADGGIGFHEFSLSDSNEYVTAAFNSGECVA